MRVCAIDVGTNTVQSLVADVAGGALVVVADEERFARLGQGVDAGRRLAPEAMDRALACLAAAQQTARRLGADRVVIGATSASRDAANVDVLVRRVRDDLGLDYRVISGEAEAALSFRGALAQWPDVPGRPAPDAPVVVVDVGGGSTEIAVGTRAAGVAARASLDVGSVRLTERHISIVPPGPASVDAARDDVRRAVAALPPGVAAAVAQAIASGAPVVATGSVARLLARLAGSDTSEGRPPPRVPVATVAAWSGRLVALAPAATLALDPAALAGREDVAAAAVLVLATVLDAVGADAYVTTRGGLRHGLALSAA